MSPVVRFAAVPSRVPNVGDARVALVNGLFAKSRGGTFLVRLDEAAADNATAEIVRVSPGVLTLLLRAPRGSGGKTAKVRADGTLIGDDVRGSIHQVGAHLEGAPSCNGWTYWHFKREGKMVSIDILRQQIRAEMETDQPGSRH